MKMTKLNMAKWIRESNAIEGYYFLLDDVMALIEHFRLSQKLNAPVLSDNHYVLDHYQALEYVKKHKNRLYNLNDVYNLHFILMNNLLPQAGSLRDKLVMVGGRICPRTELVLPLLENWIKMQGKSPVKSWTKKKACLFRHYEFEYIHPFPDGNGRVGRLLYLWDCLRSKTSPSLILSENRFEYYQEIQEYTEDLRHKYLHKWD